MDPTQIPISHIHGTFLPEDKHKSRAGGSYCQLAVLYYNMKSLWFDRLVGRQLFKIGLTGMFGALYCSRSPWIRVSGSGHHSRFRLPLPMRRSRVASPLLHGPPPIFNNAERCKLHSVPARQKSVLSMKRDSILPKESSLKLDVKVFKGCFPTS